MKKNHTIVRIGDEYVGPHYQCLTCEKVEAHPGDFTYSCKKNPHAVSLGKKRWDRKTPEEIKEHMDMMNKKREKKQKAKRAI